MTWLVGGVLLLVLVRLSDPLLLDYVRAIGTHQLLVAKYLIVYYPVVEL
jgi:hypothetical protein